MSGGAAKTPALETQRPFDPQGAAVFRGDKMGKATLFQSPALLAGLNCLEAGQSHALHAHAGQDKLYVVLAGRGLYLRDGERLSIGTGEMVVAPRGVAHGIENPGPERLIVLVVMAPAPG